MTTKYLCRECQNEYHTDECPCANGCTMGFEPIEGKKTDQTPVTELLREAMAEIDKYASLNPRVAAILGKPVGKIWKAVGLLCQE